MEDCHDVLPSTGFLKPDHTSFTGQIRIILISELAYIMGYINSQRQIVIKRGYILRQVHITKVDPFHVYSLQV